jgi:glycosyltransferase involved in cell wall biosynthesis
MTMPSTLGRPRSAPTDGAMSVNDESMDARARTVLHVLVLPSYYETHYRPYNGAFFRDWACALQRSGVQVGVAYMESRGIRELSPRALRQTHFQSSAAVEDGLPTVRVAGWNPLSQWTAGGLVWARLTQRVIAEYIARHGRPDIIAAQSATWAGQAARLAKRRWGLPYVITEVNTRFGTGRVQGWEASVCRGAFSQAEAVIAISENLRERLREFGGVRHVELIPCTVDDSYWTLPARPRQTRPFTFYAQAHLTPRKGFDVLIRAFARRFGGDDNVRLVIGGGGEARGDLEALVASTGIRPRVTFLGAIPRDAIRAAMWEANCFVLPSYAENFGVVLIEALSTGLPVISTRCGGPEDIIDDSVGMLLRPGDEAGLGEALATMMGRPAPAPEPIRAHAIARYGYAAVGRRLRDFYCTVLDKS